MKGPGRLGWPGPFLNPRPKLPDLGAARVDGVAKAEVGGADTGTERATGADTAFDLIRFCGIESTKGSRVEREFFGGHCELQMGRRSAALCPRIGKVRRAALGAFLGRKDERNPNISCSVVAFISKIHVTTIQQVKTHGCYKRLVKGINIIIFN